MPRGSWAIDLLAGVLADGIRLDFACGDEVYGSCTQLWEYLEARGRAYVLRVPSSFCLTAARLPGAATRWRTWRRRHQGLAAWYHQRTRLTRDADQVSQQDGRRPSGSRGARRRPLTAACRQIFLTPAGSSS